MINLEPNCVDTTILATSRLVKLLDDTKQEVRREWLTIAQRNYWRGYCVGCVQGVVMVAVVWGLLSIK